MTKRILVGLDGSPLAESILPYVTTLAKRLGADVRLLHVTPVPDEMPGGEHPPMLAQVLERAQGHAEAYLQRVEQQVAGSGVPVQRAVANGDVPQEIVADAQREAVDLIALATHGRSGVQRWLVGSVAERLVYTSPIPVLLVRPTAETATQPPTVTRIIVPLDGSPMGEASLPVAESLAQQLNVPLLLLRVVEPIYVYEGLPAMGTEFNYAGMIDDIQAAADAYLQEMAAAALRRGIAVETETRFGSAAVEILADAEKNAGSLLVMATHGRTGLSGTILGSIARRVVQHGNMPVVVVRPEKMRQGS